MIATKTNLEITEYREKFFLGLSLRQLACFAAAAVLAIATCFVCLHWLRMDMPSHLRCAAGRAIQAWASIWIVRALSNIAIGRRTCLFPQAAQPPIGTQQT